MDYAERQVKFWSFIGPLMILFILTVTMVRFSPQQVLLPLTAVLGALACSQWKMRGLIASLCLLSILLFFNFHSAPVGEYYWIIGIFMALSLGLVITTLSYEEVEEMVLKLKNELQRQISSSNNIEERYLSKKEEWEKEKSRLLADLEWTKEVAGEKEEEYRKLLNENSSIKKESQTLRAKGEESLKEIETLKTEAAKQEETTRRHHEVVKQIESKYEKVLENLKDRLGQHRSKIDASVKTPNFEAMYNQLKKQFEKKQEILDATRRELFSANEEVLALKKEVEERLLASENDFLNREADLREKLSKLEEDYEEEIASLHELIAVVNGSMASESHILHQ